MIKYKDKCMNSEDVRMEDVNGMAVVICDKIVDKLREKGLLTQELQNELENDGYVEITGEIEKIFNYPEYRSHL